MGFLMVSEVTPFPGVTSDTETCLVSPLLLIRFAQKFTKFFLCSFVDFPIIFSKTLRILGRKGVFYCLT